MADDEPRLRQLGQALSSQFRTVRDCVDALDGGTKPHVRLLWAEAAIDAANECIAVVGQICNVPDRARPVS